MRTVPINVFTPHAVWSGVHAMRAVSTANARVASGPIQQMASLQHGPVDERKKEKLGAQEACIE